MLRGRTLRFALLASHRNKACRIDDGQPFDRHGAEERHGWLHESCVPQGRWCRAHPPWAGRAWQVGGYRFDQLIGADSKLPEAERAILADVKANATSGVVPISVGISRVAFPPKTTTAVMRRMSAVQETLANLEEARGNSEASTIKQRAQAQAQIIRDFAEQWAAVIEARGNEEATRYYEQMRDHADLAIFLSWLDTLRAGLRGSTTFVTDMTKAPFHLIDLESKAGPNGIPQPESKYIESGSGESQ